jgi:outer membrane protein TolC
MKKIVVFTVLFAFVLLNTPAAFAQEKPSEITLKEYINLVKMKHPFFTKERLSIVVEQQQAKSLLGAQDWLFSVTPSYSYLGKGSAPEYNANELQQVGIEAGIGRSVWNTGGRVGLSFTSEFTRSDTDFGLSTVYRHGFGATYTQPLLQNWKGKLDRLEYELSSYTIDYTRVQAYEDEENFLLDVSLRFLDWAYYREEATIREKRLEIAQRGLEQVQKRYEANLVDRVDVLRSEDAVRLSEQGLLLSQSKSRAKQAELAVIAGGDELYGRIPGYDLYRFITLPAKEKVMAELKSSRMLRAFDILKDQLVFQRGGLQEQDRPSLDLSVSTGLYGRDESFGNSLEIYHPDATVALIFAKPLGGNTIKGQLEKLETQISLIDEEKKSLERELESSMVSLLVQIRDIEKILDLNRKQIESARDKTKEELKLYNQGREQLTFVIQSEDGEEEALLTYAGNAYLYQTLVLQYKALVDRLFVIE